MKKENQVTIIIPNYNGIHYLDECLKSVYQDINRSDDKITTVIIVDNSSTDGSTEFLTTNYPAVKIIALSENTGFCHAVNAGIRQAASEYVILLNNDTIVRPGFINALTRAIAKDRRIFSVAAKMLDMKNPEIIDNAGDFYNALGWAFSRGKGKSSTRYQKKTAIFSACAGAAIYRRDIIAELGYFDEAHFAYLEDVDIGYAARLNGYKNYFCPQAEVLHAGSAASGSRYNEWKTDLASRNSVYLIYKNMPLVQIILNLPFLLIGFLVKCGFFCLKGMGRRYLRGLLQGVKLSFSASGRSRRVRWRWGSVGHYFVIQGELWGNMLKLLL